MKRALVEKRPWLLASVAAALAYYLMKDRNVPGTYLYLVEAGSLGLLALYTLMRHLGSEAKLLAGALVLAGLGVVAVELDTWLGAVLLVLAYAVLIALFLKHRRSVLTFSQSATAAALLFLSPAIMWALSAGNPAAITTAIYGLTLGGMAGAGWTSGYPRYRVGLGAIALDASSLLSVAGQGALTGSPLPGLLAWPLFYLGFFVIATGVVQTLRSGAFR
ncbi:MAG: lysoplasmalogenase [Altererythrobacter sp.]